MPATLLTRAYADAASSTQALSAAFLPTLIFLHRRSADSPQKQWPFNRLQEHADRPQIIQVRGAASIFSITSYANCTANHIVQEWTSPTTPRLEASEVFVPLQCLWSRKSTCRRNPHPTSLPTPKEGARLLFRCPTLNPNTCLLLPRTIFQLTILSFIPSRTWNRARIHMPLQQ